MTNSNDKSNKVFEKRKQSILSELESIKHLLDGEADHIPVLEEPIPEDELPKTHTSFNSATAISTTTSTAASNVDTTPHITPSAQDRSVLPGQQSLFSKAMPKPESAQSELPSQPSVAKPKPSIPEPRKKASSISQNPFLPEHVRQRLEQRQALEAATQNNAPDASETNTPASPAHPFSKPTVETEATNTPANKTVDHTNNNNEQLIDDLVAQHLPRIEAELRERLQQQLREQLHHQTPLNKKPSP